MVKARIGAVVWGSKIETKWDGNSEVLKYLRHLTLSSWWKMASEARSYLHCVTRCLLWTQHPKWWLTVLLGKEPFSSAAWCRVISRAIVLYVDNTKEISGSPPRRWSIYGLIRLPSLVIISACVMPHWKSRHLFIWAIFFPLKTSNRSHYIRYYTPPLKVGVV